ncbi:hypothetical protein HYDPIDRAFT_31173 [Hydnomerulius pinastri MD-312]|uniref:Malate dehydrogenase n=1 Tax=Hydnomerulius pinastri MD-312 TaxID=994086 RepID=A0A0C9VU77_9AGAM|nr:hypothetical protein HYDPIDRAFT_31173 [Hydnomerulius pinastri MD-312]
MPAILLALGFLASLPYLLNSSATTMCNLSQATLQVPANQTQLVAPTTAPNYIALGVGVQNYTCNATSSTYTLVGAVAELFDISCLYNTPAFDALPSVAYTAWNATTANLTIQDVIGAFEFAPSPLVLGQHYYVPNPDGSGLSPKWDFTSSGMTAGNSQAYVIGAKTGDLPSLDTTLNIDSLMVKGIQGDLASEIFRIQNNGGQPPAKCSTAGANITVKYTAQYCECWQQYVGGR